MYLNKFLNKFLVQYLHHHPPLRVNVVTNTWKSIEISLKILVILYALTVLQHGHPKHPSLSTFVTSISLNLQLNVGRTYQLQRLKRGLLMNTQNCFVVWIELDVIGTFLVGSLFPLVLRSSVRITTTNGLRQREKIVPSVFTIQLTNPGQSMIKPSQNGSLLLLRYESLMFLQRLPRLDQLLNLSVHWTLSCLLTLTGKFSLTSCNPSCQRC
mmetsp:Transcript_19739/g.27533  ORF Transcript_19739/g.27533 Transcript_19739/m.27533 type:complete len:212 (+) Transcript_19739:779-1414(+)